MQAVRAEIKTWEKSFKAENGRDPTVDDIKTRPDIANKYRLYKRLSKEAAAAASGPSTPPKASQLLPSTSSVAETTAPLATFNPFSPVKDKAKRTPLPSNVTRNPFSTPTKSAPKRALSTSPSEPSTSRPPDALLLPAAPTSAVSRARKRLRGEPVSPSPNKEKKQRVLSHSKLPIPSLNIGPNFVHVDMNKSGSTVIGDSPVKPPKGSKSFTTLFQESLPPLVLEPKSDNHTPAQTTNSAAPVISPFDQPVNALPSFDEELGWLKTNRANRGISKLRSLVQESKSQRATEPVEPSTSAVEEESEWHIPLKRPLSDTELDSTNTHSKPKPRFPPLLPPSPPPETSLAAPSTSKFKSKSNNRKKAKISNHSLGGEESSEETDGEVKPKINVIDATSQPTRHERRGNDDWDEILESDPDPILAYTFRSKTQGSPHGPHPLSPHHGSPTPTYDPESKDQLEVDLPDKLRQVLALDMFDAKARDRHEERIVEKLLYNRRTVHYDPDKGGEIWGVGEDFHSTRIRWDGELEVQPDTDGDDEWEGEPIPWDVAQL